jgi:hypothetical protein
VVHRRLHAKTRISSRSIPSWCAVSDEDSPESSSAQLAKDGPQDAASVSVSGSASTEDGNAGGDSERAEESWNSNTLPHRSVNHMSV